MLSLKYEHSFSEQIEEKSYQGQQTQSHKQFNTKNQPHPIQPDKILRESTFYCEKP